jgi:hypothetical protein
MSVMPSPRGTPARAVHVAGRTLGADNTCNTRNTRARDGYRMFTAAANPPPDPPTGDAPWQNVNV